MYTQSSLTQSRKGAKNSKGSFAFFRERFSYFTLRLCLFAHFALGFFRPIPLLIPALPVMNADVKNFERIILRAVAH